MRCGAWEETVECRARPAAMGASGNRSEEKLEEELQEDEEHREEGLKATRKRGRELEEVQKDKKKKKGNMQDLLSGSTGAIKTRSKRKKDVLVEDSRERKRLEGSDKERSRQGSEEERGHGTATELEDVHGEKGELNAEAKKGDGYKSAKTRKTAKEKKEDDDLRLKRTIFVGNLPLNVKPKQLSREFCQFGAVESARLRSVPLIDSKLPRKAAVITRQLNESRSSMNGYVVFKSEESAKAALGHNMTEFNGKHLRVDMATPPRRSDNMNESPLEYDRTRSIFVGNLPFDVEDEEVYSLFKGKSADLEVEAVRIVRDPQTSAGKGFAFVCFKKKAGAVAALDNAEYTVLRNRQLRIIRFGAHAGRPSGKLSARTNGERYRSNPRSGAEVPFSGYRVSSYEGVRSSKIDGGRKKVRGAPQASHPRSLGTKSGPKLGGKGGKRVASTKRPAVAARKMASQGRSGVLKSGSKNRKNEQKGNAQVNSKKRLNDFRR